MHWKTNRTGHSLVGQKSPKRRSVPDGYLLEKNLASGIDWNSLSLHAASSEIRTAARVNDCSMGFLEIGMGSNANINENANNANITDSANDTEPKRLETSLALMALSALLAFRPPPHYEESTTIDCLLLS
jgi:hypothetical protein